MTISWIFLFRPQSDIVDYLFAYVCTFLKIIIVVIWFPEAGFKEFEPRIKFETRLKYVWFHLKLYSMFQLKPVFGGFETRLKFIKFWPKQGFQFLGSIKNTFRGVVFGLADNKTRRVHGDSWIMNFLDKDNYLLYNIFLTNYYSFLLII